MAFWDTQLMRLFVIVVFAAATTLATDNRHVFNPRMDYEEWKPLGRGDPLKNDPTYDYVPPVLDHVYYWIDPSKRTPDPPLPTVETTVQASSRLDTMGLLDPFLKIIDVSKATFGISNTPTYRSTPYTPLQRPPHTELMPPPPPQPPRTFSSTETTITSFATTSKTVTNEPDTKTTTKIPTTETENVYKPVAIDMPDETMLPDVKTPSTVITPPTKEFFFTTPTTTQKPLTTDPMFKHYKQPSKPVKGPFYLIIQGHSKVKTYGAGNKPKLGLQRPLSSNEIAQSSEDEEIEKIQLYREGKKLPQSSKESDIVKGHPLVELSASYKGGSSFTIGDLDETFAQSVGGGSSKKRFLDNKDNDELEGSTFGRKLLQATVANEASSTLSVLDEQQLHLESLIALNDDYREEEVINLLLKEEGQGSGLGGLVSSLLAKAKD